MFNYSEFMRKYRDEHYCCPNCGSRNYSTTLVGYFLDEEHPENYKDRNSCTCHDCGWRGIRHDLAPRPGIKDFKDILKKVAGIYYSEELVDKLLEISKKIYSEK